MHNTSRQTLGFKAHSLKVSVGGYSCSGPKAENQDAFAVHCPPENSAELTYKGWVACLADGVSCSENAQRASQTAVSNFINDYYSTSDTWGVKKSAAKVLSSLNSWLFHHGRHNNTLSNGLVTTFSAVVIKSNSAHIFHVGDSRVYLFRDGKLRQLSRDHCQKSSSGQSYLSRALGMDSHLEVDYSVEDLQPKDLLLISSDGFHDFLFHDFLEQALQDIAEHTDGRDFEREAKRLVATALESEGDDNCTCLLLRIDDLPEQELVEVQRQLSDQVIPPVLEVGHKLDGYEVQRVLHQGPRSHVYLVSHPGHSNPLVLKVPSLVFADDKTYLEAFAREEWVGRRLNHSGLMKILPRPLASPFLYHLCEYVEGKSLRQWMLDNPQPSLTQVRDCLAAIIPPVRALQRAGVIHGDLKPENIMMTESGQVIVLDFGAAIVNGLEDIAHTKETRPLGALDYMAPEQLLNNNVDHRADIFSLSVIIYEMLAEKLPFKIGNLQYQKPSTLEHWRYVSLRKQRHDLPLWLDKAVEKGLHPRADNRYQALSELENDLSQPNSDLDTEFTPLFERNPLLGWKLLSALLSILIVIQWFLLSSL